MSDSTADRYRRAARRRVVILAVMMALIAVSLATIGVTSHVLGSRTTSATCTIASVKQSNLRDGTPVWSVATSCGGALAIGKGPAELTDAQALTLAESLHDGETYRLTMRGVLHNPFDITAYVIAATPA